MRGFTLIELLTVIGITLVLAAAFFPIYGNLSSSAQTDDAVSGISSTIRLARDRSMARLGDSSYGVFFEINSGSDDRYVLYRGQSYAAREAGYDVAVVLDSSMSLQNTFLSDDINFSKGLGFPNATGSVTILHDVKGPKTVSVNKFGIVE